MAEEKTKDEIRKDMEEGMDDEEVYDETGRHQLIDDDEMENWEEGFMEGAEGRGGMTSCARCGKLLGQGKTKVFERKINGKKLYFCSEEHAEKGQRD